jgi:hypothetical protein
MDATVVVMIVMLAMPNGDATVEVKPMATVEHCRQAATLEISDPFVASVECSELRDGKLELEFRNRAQGSGSAPSTDVPESTG